MWAPAAPGPRQPSPAPSRPGSSRPAPREPGRHNLQSVTPGTRCTFPVASSHVGCQNPVRPGAPASGARPLGSVLIRPLHGADPRCPGRPASSGRRRGKAEPRDVPRSGVAQAEEGETPRRHSRGRRTEAVSAGTRGRGQRRGPGKRTVEDTDPVPWSRVRPKRLRDAINPRRPDTVSSEKLRPPQP